MASKKYAIIGVACLILMAAIVAVAVGVSCNNAHKEENNARSGAKIASSAKAVKQICAPTDYKESCEKTLSAAAGNTTSLKELVEIAFKITVNHINEAIRNSSILNKTANDPLTKEALGDCRELLEFSIKDLKNSIEKIGEFDPSQVGEYMADLKTWLSGAITYQQTCLDGFDNTTGTTGEEMRKFLKLSGQLTSNLLAIVTDFAKGLGYDQMKTSRRLLWEDRFPSWVSNSKRKLLEAGPGSLKPNVVVAKDGSGKYKTINEALKEMLLINSKKYKHKNNNIINNHTVFVIHVKSGVYNEYVNITKNMANVFLIGDGPTKTKITGSRSFADGVTTYKTATVSVDGMHFMAKNIGFENSAGAAKHQAVALRVSSDRSIFYNVQIDGYQDTLYCHTHRQFYRDCTISGTIDFIFGNAAAVFQNCDIVIRKPGHGQNCMVTAQGRTDKRAVTGIVLQNCTITGSPEVLEAKAKGGPQEFKSYLGRPWKNFSRTVIMQSHIDNIIEPGGWAPWDGNVNLDTLWYAEYKNQGPGSDKTKRVKWLGFQKNVSPKIMLGFTPAKFLDGNVWIPGSGVPYDSGLLNS